MNQLDHKKGMTFERKIQLLEGQKKKNVVLAEKTGEEVLEALCKNDFESFKMASKKYLSLDPKIIDEKIAFLNTKRADLVNILEKCPEHQKNILEADPVYARAVQDGNIILIEKFKNRTLSEAEYQTAFPEKSPETCAYQEEISPLFETLKIKGNILSKVSKRYINDPEKIKKIIKGYFPNKKDFKQKNYEYFAKKFNENKLEGEKLPVDMYYSLGRHFRRILNIPYTKTEGPSIDEIKNLIYDDEKTLNSDQNNETLQNKKSNSSHIPLVERKGVLITQEEYNQMMKEKCE